MKNRYDGIPSREAAKSEKLNRMYESEHNANNAFVKKNEAAMQSLGMKKAVNLEGKYMMMDACMVSDGEHAQSFARSLTAGLDKKAFPVK